MKKIILFSFVSNRNKISLQFKVFGVILVLLLMSSKSLGQTNNYFGTGTSLAGSVWSTNPAGPFTSALDVTGGAIVNFNTENLGLTGALGLIFKEINVTANTVFTGASGTIQCYSDGLMTINVSSGVRLDMGTQGLMNKATNGFIKNGDGLFAYSGNPARAGGVTINAGTFIPKGPNALGGGANIVLTFNGGTFGTDGSNRDFSAKLVRTDIRGNVTFGELVYGNKNITLGSVTLGAATRSITIGGTALYTLGAISGDAGVGLIVNTTIAEGTNPGTLLLSGTNTYTGTTTINTGILRLGSATALGTTDGETIINSTSLTSGGVLDLNGMNYTNAEPLTLNGNGYGGGAIMNSNASPATFAGPITIQSNVVIAGGAGAITLNNASPISGIGNLTIAGNIGGGSISSNIANTGSLIKNGTATWTLSGANAYTLNTIINVGTLMLGASGVIPDAIPFVLNGGTLQTGATTGFSETTGTLALTANSTITLGSGDHTLTFANSSAVAWTAGTTLTINGWTGTAGESGTAGKIFVGNDANGLTTDQLVQITFAGFTNGTQLLTTGELVPKSGATDVNNESSNSISVSVQKGAIQINGLKAAASINIFNTNGTLIKSAVVNDNASIDLDNGVYLVKVGSKVFKVVK